MKRRTAVAVVIIVSCILVFGFISILAIFSIAGRSDMTFSGFGDKVAVIDLSGEITNSSDFIRQLKKYNKDNSVKAIVLHIDSPGGAVAPSQEMYEEILKVRQNGKIVVASFGSVAASGGYYVGCAADKIVANPGTLTGSIGVILSFPTAQKLMEKIGLNWETIKSGELKDVGSFSRAMTTEDERMLKAVIDDTYEQFVEAVAKGRDRDKEEIYPFADGSIFTGRQAYNIGLVDTLGSFEDAVSMAGEMADLGPNPDIVREKRREPSFVDYLTGSMKFMEKISDFEATGGPALMYLYR
ncbi:MAG: signal peptide peptidase SppA [candidate division Zixibacteria bacterium]|nr:signal peptide peptidase SppA [candidate division Zixibacteria bacterium]